MTKQKFLIIHLITTAVTVGLSVLVCMLKLGMDNLGYVLLAVGITSVASLVAFFLVFGAIEKSTKIFMTYTFGSILIKMLLGIMVIILLSMYVNRELLFTYSVSFLVSYAIFTTIEVWALLKRNKEVTEAQKADNNPS